MEQKIVACTVKENFLNRPSVKFLIWHNLLCHQKVTLHFPLIHIEINTQVSEKKKSDDILTHVYETGTAHLLHITCTNYKKMKKATEV